jgi:hypothetical protein
MPNVQQPEMRRSGRDPLVQDSVEQRAQSALPENKGGGAKSVPEAQQSSYGPRPPKDRTGEAESEPEPEGRASRRKP